MLPPQLKPMSYSQKQMCAYKCCTIMKILHESLLKYHKKQMQVEMTSLSSRTRSSINGRNFLKEYKSEIMSENSPRFPTPQHVIDSMTCNTLSTENLPMWKCVMGRCEHCPNSSIPPMELSSMTPSTYNHLWLL